MSLITKQEVLKVARMAHLKLTEEEVSQMQSRLEGVLSYAARVQDIAKDVDGLLLKNSNIERDDIVVAPNPEPIRAQAPEREGDYFVVPVIIETNQ